MDTSAAGDGVLDRLADWSPWLVPVLWLTWVVGTSLSAWHIEDRYQRTRAMYEEVRAIQAERLGHRR